MRDTLTAIHTELAAAIAEAQREGTIAGDADPDKVASLLLAVLRGIEAVHKGGVDDRIVVDAAEQALNLIARKRE